MPIRLGSGVSDPSQMWFGNNAIKEVWAGGVKIWPTGPKQDADYLMEFDDSVSPFKNTGLVQTSFTPTSGYVHGVDHLSFLGTARANAAVSSNWTGGWTVAYWSNKTPYDNGWRTVFHRAPATGSLNQETYIVQNTIGSTVTTVTGLKLGSVHREFSSDSAFIHTAGWTHTAVVWQRTSSTAFNVKIYVNGILVGNKSATGYASNASFPTTNHQLYVGSGRDDSTRWFGDMDDFAVWSRPLPQSEINDLYSGGRSLIPQILGPNHLDFIVDETGSLQYTSNFNPNTWSATGLPAGVSMSSNGVLSGTPTTTGSGSLVITASSTSLSATKTVTWTVETVPSLVDHGIQTQGQNKVSHSGWARPALTWTLSTPTTGFSANGGLVMQYGRGYVTFTGFLQNARESRVMSNLKGVVLSLSSRQSINVSSGNMIFEEGEVLYVEVNGYSGTASDSLFLRVKPPK